jgi:hypothetical protein
MVLSLRAGMLGIAPFDWEIAMRRLALALFVALCGTFAYAQATDDPLTLITDIYKTYQSDTDHPGYANVYSRRLQALTIALVSKSAAHAQVRAQFFNFKDPHDLLFDLVREDGRWFIDDISETKKGGNRWTMSKILTHAPDAFPDEKK